MEKGNLHLISFFHIFVGVDNPARHMAGYAAGYPVSGL
jgi:hypothetical protein